MNANYADKTRFVIDALRAGCVLVPDDMDATVTLAVDEHSKRTVGYWDPCADPIPGLLADSAAEFESVMSHHSNHC